MSVYIACACVCHAHFDQCPLLVVLPQAESQTSAPQSWSRRPACYADSLLPPPFSGSPHVWRLPPLASAPTPLPSLSQSEPDAPVESKGRGRILFNTSNPSAFTLPPLTPHLLILPSFTVPPLTSSPSQLSLFTLPLPSPIPHHDTPHPPIGPVFKPSSHTPFTPFSPSPPPTLT